MTDAAPTPDPDPFAELRARIRETADAAQRVQREAEQARSAEAAGRTPPRGWATPEEHQERLGDVHGLAQLLGSLRELLPAEFQQNLSDLIQQLLALARALVAWCLERVQAAMTGPHPATDGPDGAPEDAPTA